MARIERELVSMLARRFSGPIRHIQVVVGPRQVGKTTALRQVLDRWPGPSHYASADLPAPPSADWVSSQWMVAREEARASGRKTLLVLDEVQKVHRWGEVVKRLWDEDRAERRPIHVALLGSASLHVERGAQESLAGRFELHFCPHWSWPECRNAFRWNLDRWVFYGGYPGAAPLVRDRERWSRFISDALIESVLSRDVLQLAPVEKPALLRQLFMLAVHLPAQMLSFNKMLGQLQDAGNTVTLAHYLDLLSSAFLVSGLNVWSGGVIRQRASSPKLVCWNNALITALSGLDFRQARRDGVYWGRLVENAVGGFLLNYGPRPGGVYYWREGDAEVDYVLDVGGKTVGIEVKSGRGRKSGIAAFQRRYPRAKTLLVGEGGIPLERFFSKPPAAWLREL